MASILDQVPYNNYTGNGVATAYPFEFELLDAGDFVASIDGAEVPSSDYTLSGLTQAGGTCTFDTAPANGTAVLLQRLIALERDTDYQYNGDLREETVDRDFNRLWQVLQGQRAQLGGALRMPYPEQADELPPAAERLGKLLSFNSATGARELVAPSAGTATALALQLADPTSVSNGAGLVAFNGALVYTGAPDDTVGGLLYTVFGRTAKEITAGITPTNYAYEPGNVKRYGCLSDGTTNDTTGLEAAVAVANAGQPIFFPKGTTTVYRGFGLALASGARVYGPGQVKFDPSATGYVGVFHTGNIYSEVNPARSDIIIDGVRFYSVLDQEYLHFIGIRNRGGSLTDVVVKNCVFHYEASSHTGSDRWAISLGGSVGTTHKRIYIRNNECYGKMQLTAGGQGASWEDTYIEDNISIGGYVAGVALTRLETGAASAYKRIYIRRNELYLAEGNLGIYLGPDTDSGSPEEQNWEDIFIEQNAVYVTNPSGGSGVFFRKPQTGSMTRVSIKDNTIFATTAVNLGEHNTSTVVPTACYVSNNVCTRGDMAVSWGGTTFSKNEMVDDVRVVVNVSIRLVDNILRGLRLEQSCTVFSNRNTYQIAVNAARGINVNSPAANTVVLTSIDDTFSYVGSSGSAQCGIRVSGAGTVTATVIKPHDAVRSGWGDSLLRFEDSKTLTFYEPDSAGFQQTFSAAQIAAVGNVANTSGQYKFAGSIVWDSTNNRAMRASGGNTTSTWIAVDGSVTVTPA